MFSVIGLLKRPDGMTVDGFQRWWLDEHVPRVLAVPGLKDYRLWTVSDGLDTGTLGYTEAPYDGVAIISFESKAAFEESFRSPQGSTDQDSFNEGAPSSTVFVGAYYVFRDGAPDVSPAPGGAGR